MADAPLPPALPWARPASSPPAKKRARVAVAPSEPLSAEAVGLALGDALEVAWEYEAAAQEDEEEEEEAHEAGDKAEAAGNELQEAPLTPAPAAALIWCRAVLHPDASQPGLYALQYDPEPGAEPGSAGELRTVRLLSTCRLQDLRESDGAEEAVLFWRKAGQPCAPGELDSAADVAELRRIERGPPGEEGEYEAWLEEAAEHVATLPAEEAASLAAGVQRVGDFLTHVVARLHARVAGGGEVSAEDVAAVQEELRAEAAAARAEPAAQY